MKIYMFPNLDKANCYEYTRDAAKILSENGAEVYLSEAYSQTFSELGYISFADEDDFIPECDMIIAVGGDGTILKCSKKAAVHNKPILGINCGRLGFMASLEHSQLSLLEKLLKGEYLLSKRMMLDVKVSSDGEDTRYTALNDVIVAKSDDCKIADFSVSKNDKLISSLRADGVILSTATGATAYSMSAGGPIIEPDMECIEFTQICAHSLFARTMILSAESNVTVQCSTAQGCHVWVNVDGTNVMKLSDGDKVYVSRSRYYVYIIDIAGGSFFASINKKLMQPLKGTEEDNL
ncbi:MAG: NAD(+)/NADH kinase [Ruminococcus sp.]|nr:NAD(+)/NADH kinase [Ruminococcus sp.]